MEKTLIGTPQDIKARISAAFRAMRKRGFVARANFECCGGCAVEAIDNMDTAGKYGFVYYHRQDNDYLLERGECHIGHGMLNGKTPETNAASVFVDEARRQGLAVEWDGTANTRVHITGLDMNRPAVLKEIIKALVDTHTSLEHRRLTELVKEVM